MIAGATYKTYHNSRVNRCDNLLKLNYKKHADGYFKFAEERLQKEIDKLKSVKGKEQNKKQRYVFIRNTKVFTRPC